MTFHLHHAEQLEPLLDALADLLGDPPDDPFTPEVVVVPTVGLQDAVQAGLGRRLGTTGPGLADGVVANVEFLFPGRFLARALGESIRSDAVDPDPWRLPRLTWAVLDELAEGTVEVPRPGGRTDTWALARRIADLFDRYATQRPQLVRAWAEGPIDDGGVADPFDVDGTFGAQGQPAPLDEGHRWQAELWRALRRRLGTPSPPERLPGLLDSLRRGDLVPDLPGRVTLFGFASIAPTMLTVVRALAEVRDVHVHLRHPSHVAWASSPNRLAGGLAVRTLGDVTTHVRHQLLASWGRPALEARALLHGVPGVVDHALDTSVPDRPVRTLLGAVQDDLRHDRPPSVRPTDLVDPADGSVQVHACHGALRQLEVLRDALGHAFVADPTLAAHDVLVLCPDLDRFAPLVDAVFGRGALPVPVRIGDRSLTTDDPLVAAVRAVLDVVAGRATLSEVLALAQFEPVRRRFGWTVDDVEQLAEWCADLGTRWGFAADHRVAWGLPDDLDTGTWRATVDQLLAGAAVPAPTPRVVLGGLPPFDDLATDDLALVGGVADLLARLVHLHADVQRARPVDDWVDLLHEVVDGFTAVPLDEVWRRHAVHAQLDDIAVAACRVDGSTSSVPLSLVDVRALLADGLAERPGRVRLRSGAVTVTSLVPHHGVPARVVCLLGLDDGVLRGGTFDGDDVLGVHPCVGEHHPRHESRQLLLDAVLSAGERLIITCNGADLTTNAEVPFTVALVELLDVVVRTTDLDADLAPVVVRHPRHGFDERALTPGGLGVQQSAFTFDPTMRLGAMAKRSLDAASPVAEPTSPWALPAVSPGTLDVDDLVAAVTVPARVYLRDRLDVRLPGEPSAVEDGLPVDVDPLRASGLGRGLLDTLRRGASVDDWLVAMQLDGGLPPRALRSAALAQVRHEVDAIVAALGDLGLPLVGTDELEVDQLVPPGVRITGRLTGIVPRTPVSGIPTSGTGRSNREASCVLVVDFARPRPAQRLAAAVRLAVAHLQRPDVDWSAVLVTRNESSRRGAPVSDLRLEGDGEQRTAAAEALVSMAVEVAGWARRDAVPLFDRASAALFRGDLGGAADGLGKDLERGEPAVLWTDLTFDGLLRDPVLATDPAPVHRSVATIGTGDAADAAAGGRARAVADWVWGTVEAAIGTTTEVVS